MFSGIVDAMGEVRSSTPAGGGRELIIRAPGYWADLAPGASIAVDGVCLTMTRAGGPDAAFDVVAETLRRTTLGGAGPGAAVNLQKSIAAGQRIDGHFVQGHVDATTSIERVDASPAETMCWFALPPACRPVIVPKGSVAIDGISLTIAAVERDRFAVALIPTTLQRTTLGAKKAGDRVNIETDILARTVVHALQSLMEEPARVPSASPRPRGGSE
jgi:riboflavin synthase alpha subunit